MKKSLVLEGGGFRCLFTAGVLDFFLEKEIDFDAVFSVSMSAIMGANYISKQKRRTLDVLSLNVSNKKFLSFSNWLFKGNFVSWDFLFKGEIETINPFDKITFHKSKTKFYVTIFNIVTGKIKYVNIVEKDDAFEYMKASASLPIVSKEIKIDNELFIDGGVIDSLPFEKSINDGFDKTVLILTRTESYRKKIQSGLWLFKLKYLKYPLLVKEIKKRHLRYNRLVEKALQLEREGKLFIIRPSDELGIKRLERDKEKFNKAYNLGYKEAEKIFSKLLTYLNS